MLESVGRNDARGRAAAIDITYILTYLQRDRHDDTTTRPIRHRYIDTGFAHKLTFAHKFQVPAIPPELRRVGRWRNDDVALRRAAHTERSFERFRDIE